MYIFILMLVLSSVNGDIKLYDEDSGKICQQYHANRGQNFTDFYAIKKPADRNFRVDICFMAKGKRDAIILLSTKKFPSWSENVYELVIGGTSNSKVFIRGKINDFFLVYVDAPEILSNSQFKEFCVKINKDGSIQFGISDDVSPIFSYHPALLLDIKYFSFGTYDGNTDIGDVKFVYDCETITDVCHKLNISPNNETIPDFQIKDYY